MSMSVGSLKKLENSFYGAASSSINNLRVSAISEKERTALSGGENSGINLTSSGSIGQGSNGLFADVSDTTPGQEIPQMIIAQRGLEAYVKAVRAQDETLEYTLDTFA